MTDKPLDCAGTTGPVGKHDFVDDRCRVCGAAFLVMGDRFLTGICSPECRHISGEMRTAQELIEELRNDPEFAEIHRRQMEIDAAPRPDIVRPGADSCAPVAADKDDRRDLLDKIDRTLDYFRDEFPAEKDVWAEPISAYAGGISANDLLKIKRALSGSDGRE